MPPETRRRIVLGMFAAFAVLALYTFGRAVYDIGRNDGSHTVSYTHLDVYKRQLPELYTVTGAEYEAIHSCWCKAIKVLPDYSVVHKQDWFIT